MEYREDGAEFLSGINRLTICVTICDSINTVVSKAFYMLALSMGGKRYYAPEAARYPAGPCPQAERLPITLHQRSDPPQSSKTPAHMGMKRIRQRPDKAKAPCAHQNQVRHRQERQSAKHYLPDQ